MARKLSPSAKARRPRAFPREYLRRFDLAVTARPHGIGDAAPVPAADRIAAAIVAAEELKGVMVDLAPPGVAYYVDSVGAIHSGAV